MVCWGSFQRSPIGPSRTPRVNFCMMQRPCLGGGVSNEWVKLHYLITVSKWLLMPVFILVYVAPDVEKQEIVVLHVHWCRSNHFHFCCPYIVHSIKDCIVVRFRYFTFRLGPISCNSMNHNLCQVLALSKKRNVLIMVILWTTSNPKMQILHAPLATFWIKGEMHGNYFSRSLA